MEQEKKILLVSPYPFGRGEIHMQIYNLVSNIILTQSKCKMAILCLDLKKEDSLRQYSYDKLPGVDQVKDNYLFQNIRFYSCLNGDIWNSIFNLNMSLNFSDVIVYSNLEGFSTYQYPKLTCKKTLIVPLEASNDDSLKPELVSQLPYFDRIISLNQNSSKILKNWNYDSLVVNPLINTDIFGDIYSQQDIKSSFGIPNEAFVCFVISENNKDNQLENILEQFSEFSKNKTSVLYLHTQMEGLINVMALSKKLKIQDKILYTDNKSYSKSFSHELLNKFFNMADVVINSDNKTDIGSFLLCAQACKTPIITLDSGFLTDIAFIGKSVSNYQKDLKNALDEIYSKENLENFPIENYDEKKLVIEYKQILEID